MKREILMLIIGILIGAIIATGVFLVLKSGDSSNDNMQKGMDRGMMDENFIRDDFRGGNMPGNNVSTNLVSE